MTRVEELEAQVRELRLQVALYRERAERDPLTELYNRGMLEQVLAREYTLAQRNNRPLSLLALDVDHFKRVNDERGHHAGDQVLVNVALATSRAVRTTDFVFRYGGEEFVVLLPECPMDAAAAVGERVLQHVRELAGVSVSVGLVTWPDLELAGPRELLRRADEALYQAKRTGRDRLCLAAA